MAKVRSPNYPNTDLTAALAMARTLYEKDHRNKVPQIVVAQHLGHEGLSGPALGKIGVLRAYGLLEGSGDELRLTDDAVAALMAPPASPDRRDALERLAWRPALFREIRKEMPGMPSEPNLRYWLAKRGFAPDAVAKAIKAYLGTLRLVPDSVGSYNPPEQGSDEEIDVQVEETPAPETTRKQSWLLEAARRAGTVEANPGTRKEVITLDEGDVTIVFPENLSSASFADLEDHLKLFIRKMQRRASTAAQQASHEPMTDEEKDSYQ
ncbi:hypothetical protein NKI59_15910 [Mesorhizobium sp. M0598]|uniref:hypothetical protein n=1 Tax=Mesorhizobium sp. M0598 TaxID=2956968 RepID=UPI003339831B